MAQYNAPPPAAPSGNRNTIIIVVVVVLLLCCCCIGLGVAYQFGDQILQALGMARAASLFAA
jgi:hypothetical protein